jgi:hypothetical protein
MATEPVSVLEDRPPIAGVEGRRDTEPVDYAAINAVYGALLAAVVLATRERGAKDDPISGAELIPLSAATFALSKVIAREKIGTWVREPFVDEEHGQKPRGRRLRRAVGELVTCTRCVGAWSALGVVGLRLASPRSGRVVTNVLAVSAANDWMQAGFRAVCSYANRRDR